MQVEAVLTVRDGRPPLGRWLRVASVHLGFYLGLAAFAATALLWSLILAPPLRLLPRRQGAAIGQRVIMAAARCAVSLLQRCGLLRCELAALDALAAQSGFIVVANHPSLLDAMLLISRLPRAVCIGKASLWRNPLLRGGARLAGYIRNDSPAGMIRTAAAALRQGQTLLIFPEGTRSNGAGLGAFKPGFAAIARLAGAPIQVVLIEMIPPRPGWRLWQAPRAPLGFRLRLGQRFAASAHPGGSTSQRLAAEVERHVRDALDAGRR
jgi:1-acyl-sn-glycerol-3-phosphate acyltransferase